MIINKKIIAIISARGGSKRIKNKDMDETEKTFKIDKDTKNGKWDNLEK